METSYQNVMMMSKTLLKQKAVRELQHTSHLIKLLHPYQFFTIVVQVVQEAVPVSKIAAMKNCHSNMKL